MLDGLEMLHAKNHLQDFPFHTHNTYNITLVLEQVFSNRLLNQFVQAPVGSIIITNPNEVHSTICDHAAGNSFFTFYVSPELIRYLNQNVPVFIENKIIYDPHLFNRLYQIACSITGDENKSANELTNTLAQLINKYGTGQTPIQKKLLFRKFIEEDCAEKFSLEASAKKFGLDKYKFLRLFKSETGLTPNNFIILKRVEKSKQLLKDTDDLTGVAIETGFYDLNHFYKHFKKITGVTPLTYRNAICCNIVP